MLHRSSAGNSRTEWLLPPLFVFCKGLLRVVTLGSNLTVRREENMMIEVTTAMFSARFANIHSDASIGQQLKTIANQLDGHLPVSSCATVKMTIRHEDWLAEGFGKMWYGQGFEYPVFTNSNGVSVTPNWNMTSHSLGSLLEDLGWFILEEVDVDAE